MPETFINRTTSLCSRCKRSLSAELWEVDGRVVMRKKCDRHGAQEVRICASAAWYAATVDQTVQPQTPLRPVAVSRGCPFDCGPCVGHRQRLWLPIVPVTSACDQKCPICYTHNRNEPAYRMRESEFRKVLRRIREQDPQRRMVNITGGEPTLHPRFLRLLELCREEGIRRITLSTNGLRFLREERLLERLARLDARIILSFDSLRPGPVVSMLGVPLLEAKLRVLDLLEKYSLNTTLLPVLAKGVNDREIGDLVRLALGKSFIRSVEFHTMTFTGQGGQSFPREHRLDLFEVLNDLELQMDGALRISDFVPHPGAHPLCYQVSYLLALENGEWRPFTRFMEPRVLRGLLSHGLYLEPGKEIEAALQDAVQRIWAGEFSCEAPEVVLRTLRGLLDRLFSQDLRDEARLRSAEESTKAVYLHAHMDEETFDTDRIRLCPVSIQEADGAQVPSCSYNVLFRERDARFVQAAAPPLASLGPGRIWDS